MTQDIRGKDRTRGIFIVDDHPVFRQGLKTLIESEENFEVIGEAAGSKEAMYMLRNLHPDAVIVDLTLGEGSGLQLIKSIRQRQRDIRILVASMHDDMVYAERTLRAGASGYINKEQAASKLILALREVLEGRVYLDARVADHILQSRLHGTGDDYRAQPEDLLSNRELEVFELLGRGLSSKQIGDRLCLSHKTIDSHRERIKRKLGVDNNFLLIQRAVAWVLAETEVPVERK
ncbi:response regulator transcription factor [Marinobacteraceae bacterium S3BR75-40.1]